MGGDPCAGSSCYWLMFLPDGDDKFGKVLMLIKWKNEKKNNEFINIKSITFIYL